MDTGADKEGCADRDDGVTLPGALYHFPRIFGDVQSQEPLVLSGPPSFEPDALLCTFNVHADCLSKPDPFHSDWPYW